MRIPIPENTVSAPECVSSFELIEPVARGAHGEVWRGRHAPSGTPVAVKLLERTRSDFEREAAAIARMDHPHIVPILDMGRWLRAGREQSYLVLPWAPAGTLADVRSCEVAGLARQLLDALAHAHARGVVHLDLKPRNVLVHEGAPWLTDFSIARIDDHPTERLRGTPAYMAPEQFTGLDVGPWTDRYGLGCLLYELLAGRPPFRGPDTEAFAYQHRVEPPPPLPPHVPVSLASVVFRLLSVEVPDPNRFRKGGFLFGTHFPPDLHAHFM